MLQIVLLTLALAGEFTTTTAPAPSGECIRPIEYDRDCREIGNQIICSCLAKETE